MRVYLIYRTQLEVTLTFLLFQTTKGASAFKICRGVEAVGGSLRSVTTYVRSLESVLGMALSLIQECMKSVSSLYFTETMHIFVSEAMSSCTEQIYSWSLDSFQNRTTSICSCFASLWAIISNRHDCLQHCRNAPGGLLCYMWRELSPVWYYLYLDISVCVSLQCDFVQREHDVHGWLLEGWHVSFQTISLL